VYPLVPDGHEPGERRGLERLRSDPPGHPVVRARMHPEQRRADRHEVADDRDQLEHAVGATGSRDDCGPVHPEHVSRFSRRNHARVGHRLDVARVLALDQHTGAVTDQVDEARGSQPLPGVVHEQDQHRLDRMA
jgi:hypothetical protein